MSFREKLKRDDLPTDEKGGELASMQRGQWGCPASLLLMGVVGFFPMTVLIGLIILIGAGVLWLSNLNPVSSVLDLFQDTEPEVVDSRTIVLDIQEQAMLETIAGDILITKTVVDRSAVPDAQLDISYVGSVRAGIDLSRINANNVLVTPEKLVVIFLPPAKITHCALGKPEIHTWKCRGWVGVQDCSSRREQTESAAYDLAMQELLETAYELGLLTQATQKAEGTLVDLLKSLGYKHVTFQVSDEVTMPDESCIVD